MQTPTRFTRDAVFKAARILDSTKSALKQGGFAYEQARSATDDRKEDSEAFYANAKRKFSKGKSKGSGQVKSSPKLTRTFKGKEFEHDVNKHPKGT
jgi:hypothetical protein